ncbi:MAG TPA: LacI family DNA-binding transcriptional regulator [Candidatus Choladocola avistercoris]|nr:LacI family DNA-binding transcriptional regulator [Candidatus Choladocola avistercoris]
MKPRKEISIRDIAAKSGYSTATVSRVLNRQGGYSEAARQKIMDIVEESNYSTGSGTLPTVGILVPDLTNEWFAEVTRRLEQELFARNYHCCICSTEEDPLREKFCFDGFSALKTAAVISFLGSEELAALSRAASFPVIFIDQVPEEEKGFLRLEFDNYLGGYMATELLIRKGCQRILYIGWHQPASVSRFRQQGYSDALKEYGLSKDPELILDIGGSDQQFERTKNLVYYTIRRKIAFDGIFASNDLRASGALEALKQSGIDVPSQVKIIGYDDTTTCCQCYPTLSTVRQDPDILVKNTVELLFNQLEHLNRLTEHRVLPVSIVERMTT